MSLGRVAASDSVECVCLVAAVSAARTAGARRGITRVSNTQTEARSCPRRHAVTFPAACPVGPSVLGTETLPGTARTASQRRPLQRRCHFRSHLVTVRDRPRGARREDLDSAVRETTKLNAPDANAILRLRGAGPAGTAWSGDLREAAQSGRPSQKREDTPAPGSHPPWCPEQAAGSQPPGSECGRPAWALFCSLPQAHTPSLPFHLPLQSPALQASPWV